MKQINPRYRYFYVVFRILTAPVNPSPAGILRGHAWIRASLLSSPERKKPGFARLFRSGEDQYSSMRGSPLACSIHFVTSDSVGTWRVSFFS